MFYIFGNAISRQVRS